MSNAMTVTLTLPAALRKARTTLPDPDSHRVSYRVDAWRRLFAVDADLEALAARHPNALTRADVARLDQQVPEDLLPVYVQLLDQRPAVGDDDPEPLGMPELDEGPHLSYAIQWVIFSTVAVVGYPLILRRRAREIGRGDDEVADGGPPDDGPDVVPPREPAVDAAPPST